MAQNGEVEKTLLEKIQDLLERKPEQHDVSFCVGKEKTIVRALKIILKASSPFLEKEFEKKWEVAVIKEGEGIPLPDFDPVAFELFVKLTSLDTWSLEVLKTLNLPPNQILNLLSICRRFKMKKAVKNLETLTATFMQSFGEYKDTDDFLQLSQTNLKSVLVSDDIGIKELDVFHSAIRWADFRCKEMNVEATEEHIREVLGDCLFEIRFPIMTNTEFTESTESNDILTAEECLGIYKFIGLSASKKMEFDAKKLPFKTGPRKNIKTVEPNRDSKTDISGAVVPVPSGLPGVSSLCLTQNSQIVGNPPFVCDGSEKSHCIASDKNITVYGLGFLGPLENDGFYDVKVQFAGYGIANTSKVLKKRILAQKGKQFYFVFDTPVHLQAGTISKWSKYYCIRYYLKGPNTYSILNRTMYKEFFLQGGATDFRLECHSKQLTEILFKLG